MWGQTPTEDNHLSGVFELEATDDARISGAGVIVALALIGLVGDAGTDAVEALGEVACRDMGWCNTVDSSDAEARRHADGSEGKCSRLSKTWTLVQI